MSGSVQKPLPGCVVRGPKPSTEALVLSKLNRLNLHSKDEDIAYFKKLLLHLKKTPNNLISRKFEF